MYVCDGNQCSNNGTCVPDPTNNMNFTCDCLLGYSGMLCEGMKMKPRGLGLRFLKPISTKCQLYHGDQFYC